MIGIQALTKKYGATTALAGVTCTVAPGRVTALLGPNGAGKSTLMRVVLGLDHPTTGQALIDGVPYRALRRPSSVVGAHLGGTPWHPRRSARAHLRSVARAARLPVTRVGAVLDRAGLTPVAHRRAGGFSLGMAQRLGLAAALLGDPAVLILDEPVNGLDTDGVAWIRGLLRELAGEGRTVLVSSHLLTEMQLVADHVLVLGRGRLLADGPMTDLTGRGDEVVLETEPDDAVVARLLARLRGVSVTGGLSPDGRSWVVRASGTTERALGEAAHRAGVPVYRLVADAGSAGDLEAGYRRLVAGEAEHRAVSRAS